MSKFPHGYICASIIGFLVVVDYFRLEAYFPEPYMSLFILISGLYIVCRVMHFFGGGDDHIESPGGINVTCHKPESSRKQHPPAYKLFPRIKHSRSSHA